ncbi:hypothetical protein A2U01_0038471, partial [Trifolium medium]|nr:hypothetical protein [Trifolium medium]
MRAEDIPRDEGKEVMLAGLAMVVESKWRSFCQFTPRRGILAPRRAELGSVLPGHAQAWEAALRRYGPAWH